MTDIGLIELLKAGVHFGHQTQRWDPRMRRYIHGERDGAYLIDLNQTEKLLNEAARFAGEIAGRGGSVLFVGTKKAARDVVKETASSANMPFVAERWLGGLMTNFQTIKRRIDRLHDLERYAEEGQLRLLPTRERLAAEADLTRLQANLGGVKDMKRPPDALFVIDVKLEAIAVREAARLRIPVIGLVDTNCDPTGIDYVIPGNDDSMRACRLIASVIADAVNEKRSRFVEEEARRRALEETERKKAAEQRKKEIEEQARRDAEEATLKAAESQAERVAEIEARARAQAEQEQSGEASSEAQGKEQGSEAAAGSQESAKQEETA